MAEMNGNGNNHLRTSGSLFGDIGLPTVIIAVFWVLTLVAGHFVGISMSTLVSDTIKRAGPSVCPGRWSR